MPTGKTKDAGWQIGVSTTLDHPIADVWNFLTAPDGISIWLLAQCEFGAVTVGADGDLQRLASEAERERQRKHWKAIAAGLADKLDERAS